MRAHEGSRCEAALLRLCTALARTATEFAICQVVARGLYDEALGYDVRPVLLVDAENGPRVLTPSCGRKRAGEPPRVKPGAGTTLPLAQAAQAV